MATQGTASIHIFQEQVPGKDKAGLNHYLMDIVDFLLAPVYILILYLYFKRKRKKFTDPVLKKYHATAFWVKMLGCTLFVIYYAYLTSGDTLSLYHAEGNNLYHLILKDGSYLSYLFKKGTDFDWSLIKNPFNKGYFFNEGNVLIIKLDAVFSFVTLGRYFPISLLFAGIAFSGLWKLFLFFYEQKPALHKAFAFSILYFPSVVFWSSGLMKDSLCMAALGWLTYAAYELFYKRRSLIKNALVICISVYLLAVIKVYILLAYVPFFSLFILLKNMQLIRFRLLKYVLLPVIMVLCIAGFMQFLTSHTEDLGGYALEEVTSSMATLNNALKGQSGEEDAASNFSLGAQFDGTLPGLIKIAPYAVIATFFRPFIWEAHKLSQLMAAIESLVLIFFSLYVLYKTRIAGTIKWLLADPLIMYCFFYALVFGLFIGASTPNFGTLVRYKIPCLPFYAIALFLVLDKVKENRAGKEEKKLQAVKKEAPLSPPQ